jgi:hypothetical protein
MNRYTILKNPDLPPVYEEDINPVFRIMSSINTVQDDSSDMSPRRLENKAKRCLAISKIMLEGEQEKIIEDQAVDLMFLNTRDLRKTFRRLQSRSQRLGKLFSEFEGEEALE